MNVTFSPKPKTIEPTYTMPEPITTPTPAPAPKTQPRGYFNQAQVADIALAEKIIGPASDSEYAGPLDGREITAAYVAGLAQAVESARGKMAASGQAQSGQQPSTLNASEAESALITVLQGIQSAAKQRQRMEAEDDDETTNFSTEGYLIGQRLNANRALLLQNAATLLGKARTDALPGYKTPAAITAIENAIAAYKNATLTQAEVDEETSRDRIERDKLVRKINSRRIAIQHAADALFPYTNPDHAPTRRRFALPPDRPVSG